MERRLLTPAALLVVAVLGSGCGTGEIGAGSAPSDAAYGDPRAATSSFDAGTDLDAAIDDQVSDSDDGFQPERPWAHNTGPSDPGALSPSGPLTITTDGAVLENLDISGAVEIEADNVTLRNCRITGGFYNVQVDGASSNLLIEDCELTGGNNCVLDYGSGSTFRRVWCHDQQSDGMKFAGSDTVLENSFLEKIGMNGTSGHHDLVQATGCSNCEIRFSNLRGETCQSPPYHQSVAVMLESLPNEFVVRDSWLEGGSAPSIINGSSTAATRLSNNKFGTYYNSSVYTGGSFINDGGNVFECDNSPVHAGNPPRPACATPFPGSSCQ